ncbi:MAG: Gfo/Idh/MocA family protein [Kiritimatiellia bacterium]|nr:Gfo/Idh/MocA family oxidoreductase [Lentisphaerota bacterium]
MSIYKYATKNPANWLITGACEEDAATREQLASGGVVAITHHDHRAMLDEVECDVVAVGDYYSRRGSLIMEALRRGKHVIADKPICTKLSEYDEIAGLIADRQLIITAQLDLRFSPRLRLARELVRDGAIGKALSVSLTGQHALSIGVRPAWYFEEGRHGGTINDIGIHAFDLIPWITGLDCVEIVAARTWNALALPYPHFNDGAQFMVRLSNGAGFMGDMSYFAPGKYKGTLPQYWRLTLFGDEGVLETGPGGDLMLCRNGRDAPEMFTPSPLAACDNLPESFAREIAGADNPLAPSTREVLRASRAALAVQQAADTGETGVLLD